MASIDQVFSFLRFTHKFNQVQRQLFATGENRNENDSEHSFQLALLGWYLISSQNLQLDLNKVIHYSLVHDLVEIYAGDTFFHDKNNSAHASKKGREHTALERIKNEFPEFSELPKLIQEYEELNSPEARFVSALDKVIPVMNIYLDNGRSWEVTEVSYEMIRSKDKKIEISEDVMRIWKEFVVLVERDRERLHLG